MLHQTSRNSADRHGNGMSRSVVEDVDDTKFMQETTHSLFAGEQQKGIEHVHQYGFTCVPQKPTGSGRLRQAAEAIFSFLGGGRSHGMSMLYGDRRFRLYKLQNGEVALHDDQGHQIHIARDGLYVSAPNSKKVVTQIMDDDTLPQDTGSNGEQKNGQIQQKGRPSQRNMTIDVNGITINHPGDITWNIGGTVQINADKIISNGKTYLGGTPDKADKMVGRKLSVTDAGDKLTDNLSPNVWST